jgi:hypothetical protein
LEGEIDVEAEFPVLEVVVCHYVGYLQGMSQGKFRGDPLDNA